MAFEIAGLASAGRHPFDVLARNLTERWVDWFVERVAISEPGPEAARDAGAGVFARLLGLLLLRELAGAPVAEAAARESGIR